MAQFIEVATSDELADQQASKLIVSIVRFIRRAKCWTKCLTSSGMSSARSRRGGT